MTLEEFRASLVRTARPKNLGAPLSALWHAAKDDWDGAHKIVQDDPSREAAWVHAYLHRVEGDLANARYWYARAAEPVADGALDAEWSAIAAALLARGSR